MTKSDALHTELEQVLGKIREIYSAGAVEGYSAECLGNTLTEV